MTEDEKLNELKRIVDAQPGRAIALMLKATETLLACAPMRSDTATQAIAAKPGAGFAVTVTTAALSIEVRAGEESIAVFRHSFEAPTTFGDAA